MDKANDKTGELKFLHDISSPLTSILLNLENVIGMLEDKKDPSLEPCLTMLGKCIQQTKKSTDLLTERRARVVESAQSG